MCGMDEFDEEIRRGAEEWGRMMEDEEKKPGEEGEDEGDKPRVVTSPAQPSAKEIEEHMVTHIPFRSWCPHCVAGKSKSNPHRKNVEREAEVPEIHVDYMYMTSGNRGAIGNAHPRGQRQEIRMDHGWSSAQQREMCARGQAHRRDAGYTGI